MKAERIDSRDSFQRGSIRLLVVGVTTSVIQMDMAAQNNATEVQIRHAIAVVRSAVK